jgi:hypothetical protein
MKFLLLLMGFYMYDVYLFLSLFQIMWEVRII